MKTQEEIKKEQIEKAKQLNQKKQSQLNNGKEIKK